MLCVAHASITCRICYGADLENAPENNQTEFTNINSEIAAAFALNQDLKGVFSEIIKYKIEELKSTQEYQDKVTAAQVADVETDFRAFIDELVDKHDSYREIEILKNIRNVLDGTLVYDAALYLDIAEKVNQLDESEREICSAYVQKLIDDDGSGTPIDGELKRTNKRKFKLKM